MRRMKIMKIYLYNMLSTQIVPFSFFSLRKIYLPTERSINVDLNDFIPSHMKSNDLCLLVFSSAEVLRDLVL